MTPGLYLVLAASVYGVVALFDVFYARFAPMEALQVAFLLVLALPVAFKWVGLWVGLEKSFMWKGK